MNANCTLFFELSRIQAANSGSTPIKYHQGDFLRTVAGKTFQTATNDEVSIEALLEMRACGVSYYKIASRLNHMGIGALRGGQWYGATIYTYMRDRCCELLCEWPKQVSKGPLK